MSKKEVTSSNELGKGGNEGDVLNVDVGCEIISPLHNNVIS